MNYVEVIGGKPRQREYVESMVNYCIDMLMPRMSTLDITVTLKDIKDDAYGYCLSDSTRFFELEIDKNLSLRRASYNCSSRNGTCQTICSKRT